MVDALFLLSLLCGLFGAGRGSRVAWALLASTALSSALILAGAPFDLATWIMIDVAVIVAAEYGRTPTASERGALALFPVAWVLYHLQPAWWNDALTLIVAAQFLLVTPWGRFLEPSPLEWRTA